MSYDAKPIFFLNPARSTPQIKEAMVTFLDSWLLKHSYSEDLYLFHYTNLQGLKGILNSRSLWLSHTSTLNDPSELIYGKQLILDILKEAISNEKNENIQLLLEDMSSYLNAFDTVLYQTFVACLCKSDNLLSQWRGYASRGGGYNLGFKFKSDTKFYEKLDNLDKDSYVILRKIIYDVDEQKELISNYISTIVSSAAAAIQFFTEHGGIPAAWPNIAAMEAANILFDFLFSFKNPVFSEENEWRIIIGIDANRRPELLKFIQSDEQIIPYVELFVSEERDGERFFPLHSIKFGPKLDESRSVSTLRLLIIKESTAKDKFKIDSNHIKISSAGYNLRG